MSLFNQLVYYLLLAELGLYLLTLVPLTFIPIPTRKRVMNSIASLSRAEPIIWTARILFFVVAGVFFDTVSRLYRMDVDNLPHLDANGAHFHTDSATTEAQKKARLFYTQRNLYLSLFAIFMILVDYRRVRDVYLQLVFQETINEQTAKVRILTKQIETMAGVPAAPATKVSATAAKGIEKAAEAAAADAAAPSTEKLMETAETAAGSLRKRTNAIS
ncbi:B-cell receptor-associated protein 31-like-domain-containing protein [Geranomyces variabilis]|nr:B-cell receptor-associated protein 31-like-domain-containing protein [Geranomyces variabilis]KAJ3132577.1 hypothetical protein HDU90_006789 [Geranomyces variabilis]